MSGEWQFLGWAIGHWPCLSALALAALAALAGWWFGPGMADGPMLPEDEEE